MSPGVDSYSRAILEQSIDKKWGAKVGMSTTDVFTLMPNL